MGVLGELFRLPQDLWCWDAGPRSRSWSWPPSKASVTCSR